MFMFLRDPGIESNKCKDDIGILSEGLEKYLPIGE